MENIIQKHRAFVAGQIEKSFGNDFHQSAQEVEKAYNVGDEKMFNGRNYYVHALNSKGQPMWRLKRDGDKKDEDGGGEKKAAKPEEKKSVSDHASEASDEALKRAAADEKAKPEVREAAKKELAKRGGEDNENKDSEKKGDDKKKPAVKYSEMTAAQANKTLVGKTIKIGDKTAKIMNAFKSSGPGSNKVYLEVVDGDDYLGTYMQISLDELDSGEIKYNHKYFGTKGQKIEISDEEPEKKEVTKESFKEFLNYIQKNIAKKDSKEFLNKEYMFLFTVPQKYRSNAGNVHNRVAATIKKLSDANNW